MKTTSITAKNAAEIVRKTPFVRGYLSGAIWTTEDCEEWGNKRAIEVDDISPSDLLSAYAQCVDFVKKNQSLLSFAYDHYKTVTQDHVGRVNLEEKAGFDLWMSRAGCGGFWDMRLLSDTAMRLADAAGAMERLDLVQASDGLWHFEPSGQKNLSDLKPNP